MSSAVNPRHPAASAPASRQLRDFDGAFDRAFSLVAFVMNRHLIDHMLRSARLLVDGDLESLVLWGVLAHQNVVHLMPPGTLPTAILNEAGRFEGVRDRLRPVLLRDLSSITGIPRETARRKLEKLAAQGYVERSGRAWVVSDGRIEPDLREHTRDSARRLLAAAEDVLVAMREAEASLPSARPEAVAPRVGPGGA